MGVFNEAPQALEDDKWIALVGAYSFQPLIETEGIMSWKQMSSNNMLNL